MFTLASVALALLVDLSASGMEAAMNALERVEDAMPAEESLRRDRVAFALLAGGEIR